MIYNLIDTSSILLPYLSAVDSKWHVSCLKCSECGMELESQVSCYERDGLILCKEDYLR